MACYPYTGSLELTSRSEGWHTYLVSSLQMQMLAFVFLYKIIYGMVAFPLPAHIQYSCRVSRYCHSMTFSREKD